MAIRIEFYGLLRRRAGTAAIDVEARSLGEAILAARRAVPALAEFGTDDGRLQAGYIANLNGRRFVTDPQAPLSDGDAVLLLSTDAGG